MKKNYVTLEFEVVDNVDVVTTSAEVETEKIPFGSSNASNANYELLRALYTNYEL